MPAILLRQVTLRSTREATAADSARLGLCTPVCLAPSFSIAADRRRSLRRSSGRERSKTIILAAIEFPSECSRRCDGGQFRLSSHLINISRPRGRRGERLGNGRGGTFPFGRKRRIQTVYTLLDPVLIEIHLRDRRCETINSPPYVQVHYGAARVSAFDMDSLETPVKQFFNPPAVVVSFVPV